MVRLSLLAVVLAVSVPATACAAPSAEEFLVEGRLVDGEKALLSHLESSPDDDEARFGLGVIQFLRGVEEFGQFLHQHGVSQRLGQVPFLRMPVPMNEEPKVTTYADIRRMQLNLLDRLKTAERTLAGIDDDTKLTLHFGQIRLDLDGNGKATEDEALGRIYAAFNRRAAGELQGTFEQQARAFRIAFDTGDVYWLRGYCHLLSAMLEIQLAYDGQQWFDHCGHLLFAKTETPFAFLQRESTPQRPFDSNTIIDAITAIHLFDFDLKEPHRLAAAREHLLAMADLSRKSWDAILAETDNDDEWLPNPRQQSVVGVAVTTEMIETWRTVMAELGALLEGEKLVPFWRDPAQGVNLKRVFTEPKPFDLVPWVQGTAAAPYLEQGDITTPETWQRVLQVFRGEFIGFALWFN